MTSIAVTGSSGFIGRELVKALINKSYQVIEIDLNKGFDLLNQKDIQRIPHFDIVIHLAARSYVPKSFIMPWEFYYENYLTTLNVLEMTRQRTAKMIYFSSYLYGDPAYIPIDEVHPLKPHNPYAQTKYICEKLCEGYSRDFNLPVTIFRPFNIYGEGQNESFIIPIILKQLYSGLIKVKDPRPRRDYIHISDIVSAVLHALEYKHEHIEIFNLGSGLSFSVDELINLIKNISDSNDLDNYPYKRFDIAGVYKFNVKNLKLDAGISVLNVFNYENIKLSDVTQIPTENGNTISIYSESVPFTPTIFLNISF